MMNAQRVNPTAPVFGGKADEWATCDPRYPYVATTYRVVEHWQTGLMTRYQPWLLEMQPQMFVELSEELAKLKEDNDFVVQVAQTLGVDAKALAYVVYTSLRPSIIACAGQLSALLENTPGWINGYCPVCGNYPGLATLNEQGHPILHCYFCWHAWTVKRGFCPFCSSTDGQSQRYFYSEEEANLRVNLCDRCGKYIKCVDIRKSDYPVYPPLEQVTTLHLDIKAQEEGYQSGIELALNI